MAEPITVTEAVRVPARAILVRTVRASGHGGQNVNKVATKIELHVDTDAIEGLPEEARTRLRALVGRRWDATGRLLVTSQQSRHQGQNLAEARDKVRALILRSLTPAARRRPTRPPAAAAERRLRDKQRRARVKRERAASEE